MSMSGRYGRIGRAVMVVGFAVAIAVPTVSAQDTTPTPDVPGADECVVDQVELSSLLSNAGGADPTSPLFTTQPVEESTLPTGPAATEEEVAGVTSTVRQLVACANAFDPFRILALISDRYVGELAGAALAAQERPELAEQLIGRFPVPIGAVTAGEPVEMIAIRDGRLLPDGRVGAILESPLPGADGEIDQAIFFVAFVEVDGMWLVDEVVPVAAGLFATPAA